MNKTIITNGTSIIFSIIAYRAAKDNNKIPALLIGGFVGNIVGAEIHKTYYKKNRRKKVKCYA